MYPNHITDLPEVLPFNRNNCRGGNQENCMYYNTADGAHYNYTAVQGTGDQQSSYYAPNNVAFDIFNAEHSYADHAMGAMGGYNDQDVHGSIDFDSYPNKPTIGTLKNKRAIADDGRQDYDRWDPYHRYHDVNKMHNAGSQRLVEGISNVMLFALIFGGFFYFHQDLGKRNTMYALAIMLGICFLFR